MVPLPAIDETRFENFFEFIKNFQQILYPERGVFIRDRFLFRGQGSSDFQLKSSFDRKFSVFPVSKRVEIYKVLKSYIKDEINADAVECPEEGGFIGLAQHYGLPTRLLDWTTSPLVAAYFAFHQRAQMPSVGRDVTIWALDRNSQIWSGDYSAKIIKLVGMKNARADLQLGYATSLEATFDTIEEFVLHVNPRETVLWKFNIDASQSELAFSFLDACNIRGSTLFGDIQGALITAFERLSLDIRGM